MNRLLLTLGTILLISGCGYADNNECMLKEQQKCEGNCFNEAYLYCEAKFPLTKAQRDQAYRMTKGLNRSSYKTLKECTDEVISSIKGLQYITALSYCEGGEVIILEKVLPEVEVN